MDVDLSTNLESFLPLVAPIVSGHSELAIGTRLARQARVRRQIKREVLSRGYNTLVRDNGSPVSPLNDTQDTIDAAVS